MAGHFKKVCSKCGTIIDQCRCVDKNKPTTYGICDACVQMIGKKTSETPSDRIKTPPKRI